MANLQFYNDKAWTSPSITLVNKTTGVASAPPSGTAFAATASPPSLALTFLGGGGGTQIKHAPLVQNSIGIAITVSATGYFPQTYLADIVADPNALTVNVDQNLANWSTTAINIPTAPGP